MLGLVVYLAGQVMIAMGRGFVDRLQPVDYAHWCLLAGALLLVPFGMRLPPRPLSPLASGVLLVGVGGIVGMCVIDFLIWSLDAGEARRVFIDHAMATPVIWWPFIVIGPWLFGIGIALVSLVYVPALRLGPILVVAGSLINALTTGWAGLVGHLLIVAGFVALFATERTLRSGSPQDSPSRPMV
ncbi:MAG: hypothetical protein AAF253_07675 [Pseudomonadota bacterium]